MTDTPTQDTDMAPDTLTIRTPVEGITEKILGLQFIDGTATTQTNDQRLTYFRRHGYGITPTDVDTQATDSGDPR